MWFSLPGVLAREAGYMLYLNLKFPKRKDNMNFKNAHVLVTGAGGFIGSHLVEALIAKGCRVRAMVR